MGEMFWREWCEPCGWASAAGERGRFVWGRRQARTIKSSMPRRLKKSNPPKVEKPNGSEYVPKTELGKLAMACVHDGRKKLSKEELIAEIRRAKYGE